MELIATHANASIYFVNEGLFSFRACIACLVLVLFFTAIVYPKS